MSINLYNTPNTMCLSHTCITEAVLGAPGSHQRGESPHTRRTEERAAVPLRMAEALAAFGLD